MTSMHRGKGNSRKDDADAQTLKVRNLYLILLRFRFPPLNTVQEAPNTLTYIPLHADSLLLFADVLKGYRRVDWRYDFVKVALFHKFDKEYPESLHCSKEYDVPLSSILIPVFRRKDNEIELYLSMKHSPHILSVIIDGSSAILNKLYRIEGLFRQEKLYIRKRDDITKLALGSTGLFDIKVESEISPKRGGYKAINLSVKIPLEYLSTELAFFADIRDYGKLIEELNVLKISGIGKKHDMGFGDLISWKAYRIAFSRSKIRVLDPMILRVRKRGNYENIITLRNLPVTLIDKLRQKNKLLVVNMKAILSRVRPPYWVREGLCLAPFSEFLLRR